MKSFHPAVEHSTENKPELIITALMTHEQELKKLLNHVLKLEEQTKVINTAKVFMFSLETLRKCESVHNCFNCRKSVLKCKHIEYLISATAQQNLLAAAVLNNERQN